MPINPAFEFGFQMLGTHLYLMSGKDGLYGIVGDTFIMISYALYLETEVIILPKKKSA